MAELQTRLERLMLRLDRMGMRVEQAFVDAMQALCEGDPEAGQAVEIGDSVIDREEVEIEQECVRLLALYEPKAIDLRTICTVIKVNSDLERIADLATSIGKQVKHVVDSQVDLRNSESFNHLWQEVRQQLGITVRMLAFTDAGTAQSVIEGDYVIDADYRRFVRSVLDTDSGRPASPEEVLTVINVGRALERVGDLCTNIAEDIIFLQTGDIVRHAAAFGQGSGESD